MLCPAAAAMSRRACFASELHNLWCAILGLKLIRETGANNPAIGYNVLPRWKD
jgi:hypothetical protein